MKEKRNINKMENLLNANFDYYELKDIKLLAEILIGQNFSNCTIEELLKNVKKVLETY